jgi:flavorubredoxin
VKDLKFVLASHADPDVMASINKWFVSTGCRLAISRLWIRFVAHYTSGNVSPDRIIAIPDEGMSIRVGASNLKAVPAHFLHAEGNFQFYDPVSRILFSGDLGASMVPPNLAAQPVQNLEAHLRYMAGFHRRYMVCNKVCRFWAQMARGLDIEMIVPQHGSRIVGKPNIARFIDWVEALSCGVDLLGPDDYKIPA